MDSLVTNFIVTKIKHYKIESVFFYLMLIYSLALIWKYDFYLTIDGPSHLYNSSLLNFYDSSDFLKHYFDKNTQFLPNYTDHILLQQFLKFYNVFFAHKLFLSLIVFFLPVTFRYAVKLISNNEGNYYFVIFPLLFNFLFHVGFYNFNLAFIFLNLQIAFTIKILNKAKNYPFFQCLLMLNSIVLFYTHAFIFGISLIILLLLVFFKFYTNFKQLVLKSLLFLLLLFPALLLFYLFYNTLHIPNYDYDMPVFEKFKRIFYFAPAIIFATESDAPYSSLITILSIVLISYILIKKSELNSPNSFLKLPDLFLILSACTIPIIFYTKNGMLSGMLSDRLVLVFFYFLFFWIASNDINNKLIRIISFFLILVSFINLAEIRHTTLKEVSLDVVEALETSNHIKNKSVVFTVNLTEDFYYGHFSNFVGVNKEVVIAENYEAELGWFPLKWKKNLKPIRCELHNENFELPDYVYVYGNFGLLEKPENISIKNFIDSVCINTYNSSDGFTKLFLVNKSKAL
jgi:hypothetical protein